MASVDDVARAALSALDTNAGFLRCVTWASERYRELTTRARFKHLRRVGELTIPAPLTTGLASFARDSTTVTGDATASPTWNASLLRRHIRAQVNWYEIVGITPDPVAATLTLRSPYAESPTVPQPQGYRITQRFSPLVPDVRFLGTFVHMRRRRKLVPLDRLELDRLYPSRNNITAGPRVVVDQGVDAATKVRTVECYPYNELSEQIVYTYWPVSPTLGLGDPLPTELDVSTLKEGVLIDLFRYEMARAQRAGQVEAAALWRNEARAQATEWEGRIMEAIRADRAQDDLTFVLRLQGISPSDDPLIMDAHDEVLARWPL